MKNKNTLLSLLALFSVLTPSWAGAQSASVPKYVNFQAVLRDDSGNLISDGFIDLEFKILDQDGDELYYELQPGVQVVRSAVNVLIGEGVEPGSSPSAPTGGIPFDAINPGGGTKFLQMRVGNNLPSDNMELGSVPYAMYAQVALGLAPDIPSDQIPGNFVTEDELAAAIEQERNDRIAGDANDLTTSTVFGGDVSGLYNNLQLGVNSVGVNEIGTDAVGADEILNDSIGSDELDVDSVGSSEISTDAVGSDEIAAGAVGSSEIADGSIQSSDIQDGTIDWGKMSGTIPESKVPQAMRPVAFASIDSASNGCAVSASFNVSSASLSDQATDCLSGDQGCVVHFSVPPSSAYVVVVTPAGGKNSNDNNPAACGKLSDRFTASSGDSGEAMDVVVFAP